MRDIFDIFLGIIASSITLMASIVVWGLIFDSDGGEPFADTLFGIMGAFPLILLLIAIGTGGWLATSTVKGRAKSLAVVALAMLGFLALARFS
ncbi:hypothetical protein [Verrucomicrobium sp. BvORR106]|uniref:hypothetical protein n=1 Tax=Verrucomicrobium sp. BvORR106 TaxID=1403819 RepID=UPI00057063D8|nr:hypothetical protein [Verrucomicrobium sp. BvORR106]